MPQIFHRRADTIARVCLFGSLLGPAALVWVCLVCTRSSYGTESGVVRVQPVPFSHEHHVGVLGIDCRYCHTAVEKSSFAGIPADQDVHELPLPDLGRQRHARAGARRATAPASRSQWQRVYNLPGFVYFDHSIHVQKGVGCSTCHGRIDEMPFTYQVAVAADGMVPGLPPQPRRSTCGRGPRCST